MVVDGHYLFLFLLERGFLHDQLQMGRGANRGGGAIIRDIYVTFVYIGRWMVVDGNYLFLFLFERGFLQDQL